MASIANDAELPLLDSVTEDDAGDQDYSNLFEVEELDVDEVVEKIGSWGKFNIWLLVAFTFSHMTIIFQLTFSYFIANSPSWKCVLPTNNSQMTLLKNTSNFCSVRGDKEVHIDDESFSERCNLARSMWTYTTSKKYSYTTEFDFVCEKSLLGAMVSGIFFGGFVINIFVAPATDKFGRKHVLLVILFIGIVTSLWCSFAKEIWLLMVLRFIEGGTFTITSNILFVLLIEFTTPSSRSIIGCIYFLTSSTLSQFIVTILAYFVRDWRRLNLYASLPAILAMIVISLVPRSPRWLLETGNTKEAECVLQNAAAVNGKCFEFHLRSSPREEADRTYTYLDLARSWRVFRLTLCLGLLYFAIGLIAYQVNLEADRLGADIYISYALSTLADIPGYVAAFYLCDKIGRKTSVLTSVSLSGLIMASIALVPGASSNRQTIRLALAILSKIVIGVGNYGFFVWLFESFPTVIRAQGGTVSIVFHQIGVIAIPLFNATGQKHNPLLVYVFVGVYAVVASIIGCALKETNNKPTRETYQDMLDMEE